MLATAMGAALSLVIPALAGVHEIWWDITYVDANPDALFARRVIGVNGTWPPPPIEVDSTDALVVHAHNSLSEPTTLHHHGMLFNGSAWMDGALGLSECGIPPGGDFDYVIPIDESGQVGTFWVHGHSRGHYVDGLRAPVVIHPPKEAYSYDDEYTVILGDWYHQEHAILMQEFLNADNPDGVEPVPDSALVYYAYRGEYLPQAFNENATLPFVAGKTYRLRIINTSAFAMFMFWIDGHDMRLIEVDGIDIEESPIDLISLSVAQRYSVLVTARSDSNANWAVHANMDTSMFDEIPDELNPNTTSTIVYSSKAETIDHGFIDEYMVVNDMALIPLVPVPAPPATRTIELEADFDTTTDGTNRGLFNQVTYTAPLVPALFSSLTLGHNATVERAYGPFSFVLEHLEVIDFVIKNADDNMHPFHFHGHVPLIVSRSPDYESVPSYPPASVYHANPMRRDTIDVPAGGSATLRIVADNPGAWFMHCHIEWHLESGLAIQLIEAPLVAQERARGKLPAGMNGHCKALGMKYSGNAAGHNSTDDLSGWHLGPKPVGNDEVTKVGRKCRLRRCRHGGLPWYLFFYANWKLGAFAALGLAAIVSLGVAIWYSLAVRRPVDEEQNESEEKKMILSMKD